MLRSVIVLLTLLSCTHGENPAVQFTLNNKGLQYGKHMGAGWIQEKLGNVTLPDISGKAVGIEYTLTGLSVQKCDFPEPSVQFTENITGFQVSFSGLNIALSGGWRTHLGIIHDGGTLDMAVFNVDVTSVVEVDKDPSGRLSVSSVKCDAQVGEVKMQFYGGASWIFKPFVRYYLSHVRAEIQRNICPGVQQCLKQLDGHLQAMNVSFDVADVLTFYYPLTDSPVSDGSSMNLGFKGEFTSFNTTKDPPFQAQPFTMSKQPDYMLTFGLSEYTLNSASYGYFLDGLLQVFINDSMIPKMFPMHLNTSCMDKYIPELSKKYPGLLMNLLIYATEAPVFSLHAGAVKLGAQAVIKGSAVAKNGTQIPLFKLKLDTTFGGKLWTAGGKLKGSVMMDNLTLAVVSTEVGPVKTGVLVNNMWSGMKTFVLPQLNAKLGLGMMLPRLKQAKLVNSVLKMEEGFVTLSSDAEVYLTDGLFD